MIAARRTPFGDYPGIVWRHKPLVAVPLASGALLGAAAGWLLGGTMAAVVLLACVLMGCAVGVVLAGREERRAASVRALEELAQALPVPVLAEVPVLVGSLERARRTRVRRAIRAGAVLLASVAGGILWLASR